MDLNSNIDGRVRMRISYIAICIAEKTTLFANRPYAWWVKKHGPFIPEGDVGEGAQIDRIARTRSQSRLPSQVSAGYVSQSAPTFASPPYRQQSRRGNKALKRNRDWRRVPNQSALYGYRRRGIPARMAPGRDRSLARASHRMRGDPPNHSRRERKGVFHRVGIWWGL